MSKAGSPPARRRGWRGLSLRSRLVLLALACTMPIICLTAGQAFLDYRAEQGRTYGRLTMMAQAVSISVQRELEVDLTAMNTLALARSLQRDDLDNFGPQAMALLRRLPAGSSMAVITPDLAVRQSYRLPGSGVAGEAARIPPEVGARVFTSGGPTVLDVRAGQASDRFGFAIDVPVRRNDRVVYALSLWMPTAAIQTLLAQQYLPTVTIISVVDDAGVVIARVPSPERYIGRPIVPALWAACQAQAEGILRVPTLEGTPALAAFTHVQASGWTVVVGAPESVVFAALHTSLLWLAEVSAGVLAAALMFGLLAARGIMRPMQQLRQLAAHDDCADVQLLRTGLPELDVMARALSTAARERRRVTAALEESEQRFRALFERAASGTILVDPETLAILDCNEAAAGFLGFRPEEFKGHSIVEFARTSSPARIQAMAQDVLAGKSWRYETQVQGRHNVRTLLNAVAPVQVGGRTLILLTQIDITDLRRAEDVLRVNEERLELARQGANLGIWDWDVAQNTLSWSEHEWALHGLAPRAEGPTPELWRSVVLANDVTRVTGELARTLKEPGRPFMTEYCVRLADGALRRLMARGQAVRGPDGRVTRMVGINMDVTARFEAEMARDRLIWELETERSRLAEIIEALPLGVGIIDRTGRLVLGNARMQTMTGPIIESMREEPTHCWIGQDEAGERLAPENYPIRRALLHGETALPGREFLYRHPDGRESWVRVGALPLRWQDGVVVEALGFVLDVDAEKRLLEMQQQVTARLEQRVREEMAAREAAQQRAARAERMQALGQIAGGIAHDFNNVLQAVSGGAGLIERRPTDPDRVLRNARMVLDAARRGAAITSRLLAFSRRGDLRAEPVDAAVLLTDMAEVLTHTLGGTVLCAVDAAENLPPLLADRGQLETVLVNLATNARDAMPTGGMLTLAAASEAVAATVTMTGGHPNGLAPGRYVRLTVSDTGTGMDPAVLARVTEPFFTTKAPGKGTGLGLAMAKGFVEQSGGALAIESAAGAGTRVMLWLPVAGEQTDLRREVNEPGGPAADLPLILLVDDDPIVRDVLKLSLEDAGYRVMPADGGREALAVLGRGEAVDLLVSDLTMPGMDGIELIRAAQEKRPGLPAVLLTGYVGDGAALAVGGAISGAFSLLRKPVARTQLVDRINALLEARRQARVESR